jgi:hypothetical protein
MTIKMYAPWMGQSRQVLDGNGQPLTITGGYATVAEKDVLSLLKQGFILAGEPECRRTPHSNNANSVLAANAMVFGKRVFLYVDGGAALTHTTETAANIVATLPNPKQYDRWQVRVINKNSGNLTLTGGNSVTFYDIAGNAGDPVITANRFADFMGMIDTGNAITYTVVGFGNAT